jgi:hypothetical protein
MTTFLTKSLLVKRPSQTFKIFQRFFGIYKETLNVTPEEVKKFEI